MRRRTREKMLHRQNLQQKRKRIYFISTAAIILLLAFFTRFQKSAVPAGSLIFGRQSINSSEYPQSLIEFMEKYPEATQFVLDYPQYKNKHEKIDISNEVTKGTLPLFIQWDKRWGYETYGDDFLAVNGCGPTCLSMVKCGLSGDIYWNPYEVAKMADEQGYYVDGVGSSWDLMDSGAKALGLEMHSVTPDAESIKYTLRSGMPIICSMLPGDFTYTGHFIILAGVNEDESIKVLDPNSIKNSEKPWDIEVLMPQIRNMWAYSV